MFLNFNLPYYLKSLKCDLLIVYQRRLFYFDENLNFLGANYRKIGLIKTNLSESLQTIENLRNWKITLALNFSPYNFEYN